MTYEIAVDGKIHSLNLQQKDGVWLCAVDGLEIAVDAVFVQPNVLSLVVSGKAYEIQREREGSEIWLWSGGARHRVEVSDPRSLRGRRGAAGTDKGPQKITAPMPGKVVRLLVTETSEVEAGQGVVVVEAMKMQNEIKSPKKGTIRKLNAVIGAAVNAGDVLAIVE
jgi:biotin carboxyl carrier protein